MTDNEDFKIFVEDLVDYLNAQEASIIKFRRQIERMQGTEAKTPAAVTVTAKTTFDVSKIHWQEKENKKGKFQISEDYGNPEHKALLRFLNEHAKGCAVSGDYFCWIYPNGSTIGWKLKRSR